MRSFHEFDGCFGDQKGPFDVDSEQALKVVERGFLDVSNEADACAIDQDIEMRDRGEDRADGSLVGDVAKDGAGTGEFGGEGVGALFVDG
jgi:hypothetical protein